MAKYKQILKRILIFNCILFAFSICFAMKANAVKKCSDGEHQFIVEIKKYAAESENGERLYTCKICDYSYTEPIPATGHIWSEWIIDKEPTCTQDGHRYRICDKVPTDIHKEEEIIPKTGVHQYKEEITPPTCDENGLKKYVCVTCGDYYTESIPALGHEYGEWIIDKEAGENEKGHKYRICKHDKTHKEEKVIPKLPPVATTMPEPVTEKETESTVEKITTDKVESQADNNSAAPKFNSLSIVLSVANITTIGLFAWTIWYDYLVISWDKRKKREIRKRQEALDADK